MPIIIVVLLVLILASQPRGNELLRQAAMSWARIFGAVVVVIGVGGLLARWAGY